MSIASDGIIQSRSGSLDCRRAYKGGGKRQACFQCSRLAHLLFIFLPSTNLLCFFTMAILADDPPTDISLMVPRNRDDPTSEPIAGLRRETSPMDPPPAAPKPSKTQSPGLNRPRAPACLLPTSSING